jgi:hypothetical protein
MDIIFKFQSWITRTCSPDLVPPLFLPLLTKGQQWSQRPMSARVAFLRPKRPSIEPPMSIVSCPVPKSWEPRHIRAALYFITVCDVSWNLYLVCSGHFLSLAVSCFMFVHHGCVFVAGCFSWAVPAHWRVVAATFEQYLHDARQHDNISIVIQVTPKHHHLTIRQSMCPCKALAWAPNMALAQPPTHITTWYVCPPIE